MRRRADAGNHHLARHDERSRARRPRAQTGAHRALPLGQRLDEVRARRARSAGRSPKAIPAAIDTTSAKKRTVASTPRPSMRKVRWQQRRKRAMEHEREGQTGDAACDAERETFNQQLSRHARAPAPRAARIAISRVLAVDAPAAGSRHWRSRSAAAARRPPATRVGPPDVGGQRFTERLGGHREWAVASEDGRGRHAGIGGERAASRASPRQLEPR